MKLNAEKVGGRIFGPAIHMASITLLDRQGRELLCRDENLEGVAWLRRLLLKAEIISAVEA